MKNGSVDGENINLVALGINNGWFDTQLQEGAYIDYAYSNNYKKIIDSSQRSSLEDSLKSDCLPAVKQCLSSGSDSDCTNAADTCGQIESSIQQAADFDVYDVREPSNDPYPPSTYSDYLADSSVVKAIGAKSTYQECPNGPYNKFSSTGDSKSCLAFCVFLF